MYSSLDTNTHLHNFGHVKMCVWRQNMWEMNEGLWNSWWNWLGREQSECPCSWGRSTRRWKYLSCSVLYMFQPSMVTQGLFQVSVCTARFRVNWTQENYNALIFTFNNSKIIWVWEATRSCVLWLETMLENPALMSPEESNMSICGSIGGVLLDSREQHVM